MSMTSHFLLWVPLAWVFLGLLVLLFSAYKSVDVRSRGIESLLERVEKVSCVGGFLVDLTSGLQRWTPQTYRIYEVDRGRIVTPALLDSLLTSTVNARLLSGTACDLELPIVTARGRPIWIRLTGEVEYENGVPQRLVGAVQDVTQRHLLDQQLHEALTVAQAADRARSEFVATMSHEIRTPLSAMIGMANLLQRSPPGGDQHQFLTGIQVAGRVLLGIINNVLDLSKIEAGEMLLGSDPFDLAELALELDHMLAPQAAAKGVELRVVTAADLPRRVVGDALRLRQILINLLQNAIKFTHEGRITLDLTSVQTASDQIRLRCVVTDTGIGIEPAQLARLFMPFAQADASTTRRFGGTGLGLSITRRLVELMGGEIGVSSALTVGSSFWVEITLQRGVALEVNGLMPGAGSLNVPQVDTIDEQSSPRLLGIRVLAVDDSDISLEVVRHILEGQGAVVATCCDGTRALEYVRAHQGRLDVILMDMQMPLLDGAEVTQRIRKDLKLSCLPIVALTAGVLTGERQRCLAAGMNDVISKPFDLPVLIRTLRRLVQLSRAAPLEPVAAAACLPVRPWLDTSCPSYRASSRDTQAQ